MKYYVMSIKGDDEWELLKTEDKEKTAWKSAYMQKTSKTRIVNVLITTQSSSRQILQSKICKKLVE